MNPHNVSNLQVTVDGRTFPGNRFTDIAPSTTWKNSVKLPGGRLPL